MQTIFPILRYNGARAAIRWLCSAFGLVPVISVPESGDYVRDAQLKLGKNLIMVGSVRPDDRIVSPRGLGSATQMLAGDVRDPHAHFARAQAAGADIFYPPANPDFEPARVSRSRPGGTSPGRLARIIPRLKAARIGKRLEFQRHKGLI